MLLIVAYHSQVPYPILLVVGGAALGFLPGMPDVQLDPDSCSSSCCRRCSTPRPSSPRCASCATTCSEISLLAIGLVIFTMVGVAVVAHEVIDGMSWQAAFVLGAVVSPTDPVAAIGDRRRASARRGAT